MVEISSKYKQTCNLLINGFLDGSLELKLIENRDKNKYACYFTLEELSLSNTVYIEFNDVKYYISKKFLDSLVDSKKNSKCIYLNENIYTRH